MNESLPVEIFFNDKLKAHALLLASVSGRIFPTTADEGTPKPYVVFTYHAGRDRLAMGRDSLTAKDIRIFSRISHVVRAVSQDTSNEEAATIASYIDDALCGQQYELTWLDQTYLITSCTRIDLVQYHEIDEEGVRVNNVGGIYEVFIQPKRT